MNDMSCVLLSLGMLFSGKGDSGEVGSAGAEAAGGLA